MTALHPVYPSMATETRAIDEPTDRTKMTGMALVIVPRNRVPSNFKPRPLRVVAVEPLRVQSKGGTQLQKKLKARVD
jgi:hypothetical protein